MANAKYRWVALSLAWLIYFYQGMIMTSMPPFLTPIIKDLNLSYIQAGTILGAWQLTYVALSIVAGLLIDRTGIKVSLALGVVIISLSVALRSFATNFETMLTAVAIFGVGGPLISIGLLKLVASCFEGKERGMAVGILLTGIAAGSAVSMAIANNILISLAGTWQNVLRFYASLGALVLTIWWFAGKEPRRSGEQTRSQPSMSKAMLTLLKNRNIWLLVMIGASCFFFVNGLRNWLPKMLESRGVDPSAAGLIASVNQMMFIPGMLVLPRLSYRVESRRFLIAFVLFLGGAGLFIIRSYNDSLLWIGAIINGFACGGFLPMTVLSLIELPEVGSEYAGGATGMFYAFGEVGGFLGPISIGYFRDLTNSFLLGIDVLIFALFSMIPFILLLKMHDSS